MFYGAALRYSRSVLILRECIFQVFIVEGFSYQVVMGSGSKSFPK